MPKDEKIVQLKPKGVEPVEILPDLPDGVRIGPYDYAIREMDITEQFHTGAMGHCAEDELEIAVAVTTAPTHQAETLLHEILHGIWGAYSLADEGPVDEEQIVTVLTKGLLQVARDNPEVLGWIARQYGLVKS
jgi:hypothetical protein